jgi:hypothetical protein
MRRDDQATAPPAGHTADTPETRVDGRRRSPGFLRVFVVVGVLAVLLAGVGVVSGWPSWLPQIGNPFSEQTTDRSQPAVLKSIQDLSRFTAASGNFEVVIDLERDRRFIPDIILSERTLFVAAGTVDAHVEFGGLTEGALVVDEAADSVEVTLPAAQLEPPNLDHERSYVFAEQRGVVNRFQDFFGGDGDRQQQVLQLAEQRIADAAAVSGLIERAQENTQAMLTGMLRALGFEVVSVTFASP